MSNLDAGLAVDKELSRDKSQEVQVGVLTCPQVGVWWWVWQWCGSSSGSSRSRRVVAGIYACLTVTTDSLITTA